MMDILTQNQFAKKLLKHKKILKEIKIKGIKKYRIKRNTSYHRMLFFFILLIYDLNVFNFYYLRILLF